MPSHYIHIISYNFIDIFKISTFFGVYFSCIVQEQQRLKPKEDKESDEKHGSEKNHESGKIFHSHVAIEDEATLRSGYIMNNDAKPLLSSRERSDR